MTRALLRYRYALLGLWAVAVWWEAASSEGNGGDWSWFQNGAAALIRDGGAGLDVYAQTPRMQFGPLALLTAVPGQLLGYQEDWWFISIIGMGLGLCSIALLERAARSIHLGDRGGVAVTTLLGGAVLLKVWALPAVTYGHPDDVLALLGIAAAVLAVARDRGMMASAAIGLAAGVKPWALLVLPLAAAVPGVRVRGVLLTCALAAAPWLPFLAADPSTMGVAAVHLAVSEASGLHLLGAPVGSIYQWDRAAQMLLAVVLGSVAVARGRWDAVPALALSVRVLLDPSSNEYYLAGFILGLLVLDLVRGGRIPAAWTLLGSGALLFLPQAAALTWSGIPWQTLALTRVVVVGAVVGAVLVEPRRRLQSQCAALSTLTPSSTSR